MCPILLGVALDFLLRPCTIWFELFELVVRFIQTPELPSATQVLASPNGGAFLFPGPGWNGVL